MPPVMTQNASQDRLLTATQLGYQVAGRWLVKDVNLQVAAGELLAIIGPNGAGKSTLFKMLSGEWPATQGRVQFAGRDYAGWPPLALAKQRAVLPQHASLTFPFTVTEVIQMGRSPHATGAVADAAIIDALLQRCDLQTFRHRPYPWLSGGEKQRVQLARVLAQIWPLEFDQALATQPVRFLFLDEPTSALDLAHQQRTLDIAQELRHKGLGVVVILHDLNLAAAYADRILLLQQGRQVSLGTPDAVYQQDRLRQVFGIELSVIKHPQRGTPWVLW